MFVSSMPEKSGHPRDARRQARGTRWVRATVPALLLMLPRPAPRPAPDRFVNGRPPAAPAPSADAAASWCRPWPALAAASQAIDPDGDLPRPSDTAPAPVPPGTYTAGRAAAI